jgi:predicted esterase
MTNTMKNFGMLICSLLALVSSCQIASAQCKCDSIEPETYQYAIKDNDTLRLDFFRPAKTDGKTPVMIFAFGGGFFKGTRNNKYYLDYFQFLAHNGWAVASIDYRLGLQVVSRTPKDQLTAMFMVKQLVKSVDMAVEDMYSATNYLIANADELNIDPATIVACGSSAGAITSCQAEWNICRDHESAKVLPAGFNYAGVVSFAGAVLSTEGTPKWNHKPCPMMFFHGSSDTNVPYNKLKLMKFGFMGSKFIVSQLEKMDSPYWFYDIAYYDHVYATTPYQEHRDEIKIFLDDFVIGKKQLQIHEQVSDLNKTTGKTKFSAKDYIMANMPTK